MAHASGHRALERLVAGASLAGVLLTGATLTREWWRPVDDTLGVGRLLLLVSWGLAAWLLDSLVVPTWRGDARRRRVSGVASYAASAAALRWLSDEPEPGSGSWVVGLAVAVLFAGAAGAAALAERGDGRTGRLGAAGALLAAAVLALGGAAAIDRGCPAAGGVDVATPSRGGEPSPLAAVHRFARDAAGGPLHLPAAGGGPVTGGPSRAVYRAGDTRVTVLRLPDGTWAVARVGCSR